MDTAAAREHEVLPAGPAAGSQARTVVRRLCAEAGIDANGTEVVLLVAHELVANAVEHGSGTPVLTLTMDDVRLRVEVTDHDATVPTATPLSDELTERGRGLMLVDTLASSWGVDPSPEGKTVWCEIDVAADAAGTVVA
jgi:anti-sigma regulatory factor (Ser/Thr protein kinase)